MTTKRVDRYVLVGLRSGFVCEPLGASALDYPAYGDLEGLELGLYGPDQAPATSIGVIARES